jgi:hypothetical protein
VTAGVQEMISYGADGAAAPPLAKGGLGWCDEKWTRPDWIPHSLAMQIVALWVASGVRPPILAFPDKGGRTRVQAPHVVQIKGERALAT